MKNYKELMVWQRSFAVANQVLRLSLLYPSEHKFGLAAQICRAAVSVPSNIAEGHARKSTKEYARFLSIALGSLAELETQILISQTQNFIQQSDAESLLQETEEIGKMIQSIRSKILISTP
jgi:four helix bundle protein